MCLARGPAKPGPGGQVPLPASGTRRDRQTGPARRKTRPQSSAGPGEPSLGQAPQGGRGYRHDFRGTAGRALRLDAGGAKCRCRFGQRPRRAAAMPGMAVRRQRDHPGDIGLPPARRSLPVPGLHQPGCRGGWRRPDRADVQPPPVPPVGASPGSTVLPEMVRLPPGAWVISTRRAWVLGETGMIRCRTPSA